MSSLILVIAFQRMVMLSDTFSFIQVESFNLTMNFTINTFQR